MQFRIDLNRINYDILEHLQIGKCNVRKIAMPLCMQNFSILYESMQLETLVYMEVFWKQFLLCQ